MSLSDLLDASLAAYYDVERELAGGGMSRVLVARDRRLGRTVVIKLLREDLAAAVSVERFRREIHLSAGLQHPHIVPVLTAGESNGRPFLVMPYVDGESVRARLQRGQLGIAEAVGILRDVARALAYAHERGIVHRDIKPDNILLTSGTATVADFGVAKAISAARRDENPAHGSLTYEGTSLGTPHYMAPEQITADPDTDARADVYAFGATAYEMLVGEPPFLADTLQEIFTAHLTTVPLPPRVRRPGIPEPLDGLIMRCLEKSPARRPTSVELVEALTDPQVVSGDFSSAANRAAAVRLPALRSRGALAGAILLLLAIAVVGIWVATRVAPDSARVAALPSIAVLPLVYVGDERRSGIAEGIASEITSELARLPGLRVASRASAVQLQQRIAAGDAVAGAIDMFIEGMVQREGSRVRVDARLVNAVDGFMLWSGSWEAPEADLFELQHRLAEALRLSMQDRLTADSVRRGPEVSMPPPPT